MNEDLLRFIEKNTARTARNTAFVTWVMIANLVAGAAIALITFA